jgi:hypothetical protein
MGIQEFKFGHFATGKHMRFQKNAGITRKLDEAHASSVEYGLQQESQAFPQG